MILTIWFAILLILAITCFLFLKKRKRDHSFPIKLRKTFRSLLNAHVHYYRELDKPGKARFENMVYEFLQYARIEGVGTAISDLDRVLIASSAVIPIFGFKDWKYQNLTNVILYPDTFDNEFQFEGENRNIMGMVGSGYMNGQMLLSRAALTKGFSSSSGKENAAIHEFVHLLDKADGATDGIPEQLMDHEYSIPWIKLMHQEMHRIQQGKTDINPYALTNEAEFFAVVSEYFFEKPAELQSKHPELYNSLCAIFEQKPVAGSMSFNFNPKK